MNISILHTLSIVIHVYEKFLSNSCSMCIMVKQIKGNIYCNVQVCFAKTTSSLLSYFILKCVNIEWQNDGSLRFISFLAQWIRRDMPLIKASRHKLWPWNVQYKVSLSSCKNWVHTLFCQSTETLFQWIGTKTLWIT